MTDTTIIHGPTVRWINEEADNIFRHDPRGNDATTVTIKPAEGGGYDAVITWSDVDALMTEREALRNEGTSNAFESIVYPRNISPNDKICGRTLKEWQELAKRPDCFEYITVTEFRLLLGVLMKCQ
jgi:hypothetical protein